MKKMTEKNFLKAKDFIFSQGRPLERSLFSFHFENGKSEDVLNELRKFQNSDGGFGNALEPDLRTPLSSVIATSQGLSVLKTIETKPTEAVLKNVFKFLIDQFDDNEMIWRITPKQAADSPHAFWWSNKEIDKRFGYFKVNPTVSIVGFFLKWPDLVDKELLNRLVDTCVARLGELPEKADIYDLHCYLGFFDTLKKVTPAYKTVLEKLDRMVSATIENDSNKWAEHGLPPLAVVTSPESPFFDSIGSSLVDRNLDFEIDSQLEDASWEVPWSWEAAFPEAWTQAEKDWKGILGLQKLLILRNFDRLGL